MSCVEYKTWHYNYYNCYYSKQTPNGTYIEIEPQISRDSQLHAMNYYNYCSMTQEETFLMWLSTCRTV